ncbi:uncharacterized protein LOC8260317 isoform X2 [Ricinus communis]|uniref:uncharacterized protein LOC8260317 isoform X2 n=1 Tax=Ricinus communis TaxID=3988 RepID=UPI00201A55F0|nr:uncharacterized protein LOC8260317 isoform X2 [Ricinus communis]
MAKYTKRLVVFLFLCLTNSLHLLTLSCSTSLQGSKDYAASRALQHEQGNAHEVHCSRERSRAAWKIIEEYLMPFVEKEHYQVSTGCRLHPDNDLYRDQEQHKIHEDGNEWRCGYCRKSFYEERYLNKHFDNRHYNLLNVSHSRCLADVCGALHCDFVMDSATRKTKCNPAAAARNKHLCEKRTSILYIIISVMILMLLSFFYIFMYLYRRGIKRGSQVLKRIPKNKHMKKSS